MSGEIWKDIPEYEGIYQISNLGRVKNRHNRILKQQLNNGYYEVRISKNNIKDSIKIHRMLGILFIPNPDNLPVIDHIDRDTKNNILSNLRWCSRSANSVNKKIMSNTNEKNIVLDTSRGYKYFKVNIKRNKNTIIRKSFKSIEDAIIYRDKILATLNDD